MKTRRFSKILIGRRKTIVACILGIFLALFSSIPIQNNRQHANADPITDAIKDAVVDGATIIQAGLTGDGAELLRGLKCVGIDIAQLVTGSAAEEALEAASQSNDCGAGPCSNVNIIIGWLVCPIVEALDAVILAADGFLVDLLEIRFDEEIKGLGDSTEGEQTVGAMETMWTNIRNLTNALFVILFVIAILGHVTGAVEAYTAKKIIPRIVIAAVLTQLSWFISTELSAIVDDFGVGIGDLIEKDLLGGEEITIEKIIGGESAVQAGVFLAVASLYGVGIFAVMLFALAGAWAVLLGFITLLFRKVVLIALVILSPLALVMWALPSTEKWAKKWMDWYTKLLLAYPLMEAIIAIGKVTSKVLTGNGDGTERDWLFVVAGLMVYLAPYALLPAMIKLATSAIGNITGFMNDKGSGLYDGARNSISNTKEKRDKMRTDDALAGLKKTKKMGVKDSLKNPKGAFIRARDRKRAGFLLPTRYSREFMDDAADQAAQRQNTRAVAKVKRQEIAISNNAQPIIQAQMTAVLEDVDTLSASQISALSASNQAIIHQIRSSSGDATKAGEREGLARDLLKSSELGAIPPAMLGDATNGFQKLGEAVNANPSMGVIGSNESAIVAYKVAIANNNTVIDPSTGKTIKADEAMKYAAITSLLSDHGESKEAADGIVRFFDNKDSSGAESQRAAQSLLQEHSKTLAQVMPRAIRGSASETINRTDAQTLASLRPGAVSQLVSEIEDSATLDQFMKKYLQPAKAGTNIPYTTEGNKAVIGAVESQHGTGSMQYQNITNILGVDGSNIPNPIQVDNEARAAGGGWKW